jgi:hypothetical protein
MERTSTSTCAWSSVPPRRLFSDSSPTASRLGLAAPTVTKETIITTCSLLPEPNSSTRLAHRTNSLSFGFFCRSHAFHTRVVDPLDPNREPDHVPATARSPQQPRHLKSTTRGCAAHAVVDMVCIGLDCFARAPATKKCKERALLIFSGAAESLCPLNTSPASTMTVSLCPLTRRCTYCTAVAPSACLRVSLLRRSLCLSISHSRVDTLAPLPVQTS